jgi:hypothetical protein
MKNSSSDKPAAELKLWYCKTYGTERSYGGNDGYEDTLESKYAYHQFVKNSRRIEPEMFFCCVIEAMCSAWGAYAHRTLALRFYEEGARSAAKRTLTNARS